MFVCWTQKEKTCDDSTSAANICLVFSQRGLSPTLSCALWPWWRWRKHQTSDSHSTQECIAPGYPDNKQHLMKQIPSAAKCLWPLTCETGKRTVASLPRLLLWGLSCQTSVFVLLDADTCWTEWFSSVHKMMSPVQMSDICRRVREKKLFTSSKLWMSF